jgi:hypothetical protein
MAGTRFIISLLATLLLVTASHAEWKLQRSDPSIRWSPVLKSTAPEHSVETGPLPPELPPAEPQPDSVKPLSTEGTEPAEATEPVDVEPQDSPPVSVLEEIWAPDWQRNLKEENSFLWRDTQNTAGVVPGSKHGFGLTSLSFESVWETSQVPGVWVVPRFTWTFASGPRQPDVQAQLFDLRLEMNFAHAIDDVWTVHFHAAPAFTSDWNNKSSDAFRLIGGGMLAGHLDEHWTVLGGVIALSRFDIPVLPVGGVRWRPNRRVEIDATFPNPRFAWCYDEDLKECETQWLYLGGQLGGNQWAVDLATDDHDKLGYRDYRIVIGTETRKKDGEVSLFEIGYVTQRRLNFQRSGPDQTPGETIMFRWGSRF